MSNVLENGRGDLGINLGDQWLGESTHLLNAYALMGEFEGGFMSPYIPLLWQFALHESLMVSDRGV